MTSPKSTSTNFTRNSLPIVWLSYVIRSIINISTRNHRVNGTSVWSMNNSRWLNKRSIWTQFYM
jgi:hypothetical protein